MKKLNFNVWTVEIIYHKLQIFIRNNLDIIQKEFKAKTLRCVGMHFRKTWNRKNRKDYGKPTEYIFSNLIS